MARVTSTKSWLWHQRLSHLNFDTINDLAKNDLVSGLPKFKYHKEHLCPSCEQGKSKKVSHPPKPVPNSRQRLHLLHMDLCGPMRIASINGKRYVLVIVDDYSCYTWVHFLRSKDEAPEAEAIATACFTQNRSIIHRRFNKTPYELINERKLDISFLHVFGALCYPKNDRKDIGKHGAKGDIGFFIGYSTDSCAYRVFNRRKKKIMETMNVSFDELSAMAFEQRVDNTKTRRPQPRSNTKNDRVPSASKSSRSKNKEVKVEEHHRKLSVFKNKKHMSSECNNIKLATQNVYSKVVCAMCKQCLISVNHDECLLNYVNDMNSRGNLKLLVNFVWKFLGTVRFENDHVAAILGFDDLQRNLEGVDLLQEDRSTNLYTINHHDMASASPICLMAHASSTKSWLWHQRLSHLNFDTINDLAKNDLVSVKAKNVNEEGQLQALVDGNK
nr:ribonuclease H-like domain-containing protein [Tanacetum cinerariifolium]